MVQAFAGRGSRSAMSEDLSATRAYYDDFAQGYEDRRRPNDPHGYHALLDDLEIELVERYGRGKRVLEAGCGTGLILEKIRGFASEAKGIDLSPGMLAKARARGLDVVEGSVTNLPYADASFDVTVSFKVLAHVPDIGKALAEMVRVTVPGGVVLAEFYNPLSLRALAKKYGPAGKISASQTEAAVYTRFDAPWELPKILPPNVKIEGARGVRIVTPAAQAMGIPLVGTFLKKAERRLADTKASIFGGFYVAILRKG
jgi:ubiquinone/menaquinone biosynthesis C-methylase UbiE